jgi:hypothetical protein
MNLALRIGVALLLVANGGVSADRPDGDDADPKGPAKPTAPAICADAQRAGLVSVLCAERIAIVQIGELCRDVDPYFPQMFEYALERWDQTHASQLAAIEQAEAAVSDTGSAGDAWPADVGLEPLPAGLIDPARVRSEFAARPPAERTDACSAVLYALHRGSIDPPQRHPLAVARWIEVVPPQDRVERLLWAYAANRAGMLWQVELDGDQVFASTGDRESFALRELAVLPFDPVAADGARGADAAIDVADGWLVSYNMGEFGAALWWFDPSGSRSKKISDDHIVDFVRVGERTLAIEGLGHMSLSEGTLIEFVPGESGWQVKKLADLPSAPLAVAAARDGTLWIAFRDDVRAWRNGTLEAPTASLPGDGMIYPVTAVLSADESVLHLGMNQYVAEIVLADGRVRMLIPGRELLYELPVEEAERMRQAHRPRPPAPARPPCPEPVVDAPCPNRR